MKSINYQDGTIAEELLPYPIVLYPWHYGAFFGFKRSRDDDRIYFCSCSKEAIEVYVANQIKHQHDSHVPIWRSGDFPKNFLDNLENTNIDEGLMDYFNFENRLCHECNKSTPSYNWCVAMYGSTFKQNYWWYIKKQSYEWGIVDNDIFIERCPLEITELLRVDPRHYFTKRNELILSGKFEEERSLRSEFEKQQRKIWNIIENEVRMRFGHKKVGEAWTSETILYYIVKKLFPDKTIRRHFRPAFLWGLELDIFINELGIGIEYQGIQHYHAVKHWWWAEWLLKVQERDRRKKDICHEEGIRLVYFHHYEELSEQFVLTRITG
jgi:hypothetical protein